MRAKILCESVKSGLDLLINLCDFYLCIVSGLCIVTYGTIKIYAV